MINGGEDQSWVISLPSWEHDAPPPRFFQLPGRKALALGLGANQKADVETNEWEGRVQLGADMGVYPIVRPLCRSEGFDRRPI